MGLTIRKASIEDSELIYNFIKELAEFEKLSHEVKSSVNDIKKSLFSDNPIAKVMLAFENVTPVGFALYFFNFSTFVGKKGLYLEDLFVKPEFRKKGYGKALLKSVAKEAVINECGRMEWSVLDWNPAREFYEHLGAKPMNNWIMYRIVGDKLLALSEG